MTFAKLGGKFTSEKLITKNYFFVSELWKPGYN